MDGLHTLVFSHETDIDAVFACATCAVTIGFNKAGIGEPAAIQANCGGWQPPHDYMTWMLPCSG